ncbi:serine protease [Arenibacterium sp. CAU 1754]
MKSFIATVFFALALMVRPAIAQQAADEVVWVQIEAHPSLRVAQERAQVYAGTLADVNGFALGRGWYGIVLGPYTRADAERVLQVYRAERQVPRDSFIAFSQNLGQQFWPVGQSGTNRAAAAAPVTTQPAAPVESETAAAPAPEPQPSDETPAEARRSEGQLSREDRKDLQTALKAAGFYTSSIDGAFGAGTRRSMRDWQVAKGYEPSGVLTTLQRKVLMDDYNAPLISVGMAMQRDTGAGIEMQIPAKEVKFARYEAPFAHYDSTGDLGARVLLISQPGDRTTLYGLYEIMQTLEIVPLDGPRQRERNDFTLEGRNTDIVSYTEARLSDGQIKGFTLIWPAGDEPRRLRVLEEMKASFNTIDGVLDPATGDGAVQDIDLVSGLEVRKPRISRSGFYVDGKGALVTTTEAVQNCTRITVDHDHPAEVIASDDTLGVAILRPSEPLAPMAIGAFRKTGLRLQSDVAVSGYSYEGTLGAPTLTFGVLEDVSGLNGEMEQSRLALSALPGDAGGPVIDVRGGVVGMLLAQPDNGRQLPDNVSLAADGAAIRALLEGAGLTATLNEVEASIPPAELSRIADGMTVLVSCWD